MDYFDDLTFVNGGYSCESVNSADHKLFDGYYGAQFIARGEILVQVDEELPWRATGPVFFFTAPERNFTYYTPNGTRDHYFVCFRGARVERYLAGGLLPREFGKMIPISAPEKLAKLYSAILLALRKKDRTSHAEAVLNLEKLLLFISCQGKNSARGAIDGEMIKKLENEIANQPGRPWNFTEIAENNNLSYVHFRRLFCSETGISPWQYVLNCRIRYACQLLHSSPLLIKEIANKCGFNSEFNFSRQFHKIMKISPEDFRKRF